MKKQRNIGSKFWLNNDFDTEFTSWDTTGSKKKKVVDHMKLASTQRAIGNFVNIVTGKQIPVRFQSNESSYTDGQTVTIGTKLDGKNFDPAVGLALHEGSHIAFTNFDLIKHYWHETSPFYQIVTENGCNNSDTIMSQDQLILIKDLLNWVEDRRIDYHVYTTAPGYRVYYEAMYDKYFNDKIIDKALIGNVKCEETLDDYLFHIINFTNPNRNLNALKSLRAIWDIVDIKNINRLKTTRDSLDVACEIYKILRDTMQDQKAEKEGDQSDTEESDDKESDGNGTQGNGSDSKESDSKESDGNASEPLSALEQKKLEKALQSQRDFIADETKKTGSLTKKDKRIVDTMKNSGTESRDVATGENSTCPVSTIVIKKMTQAVIMTFNDIFDTYYAKQVFQDGKDPLKIHEYARMNKAVTEGIILGRQLGKKLQLRNENRTLKSTRLQSGNIDRRLIASIGFGNESIFQRIVTDQYKKFFIHMSIDASGSMYGERIENAVKSAVAVAQAASMTTGIRVQISLRGTTSGWNGKSTTIYAYDSAHDKMSKIKTLFPWIKCFGYTPEGVAFESIYKDIQRDAKGDECIFINYSDGMPSHVAGARPDFNGVHYTKRVVNKMRSIGINIISYFITNNDDYETDRGTDAFRIMYGNTAEFINPTLLTSVSRSLNRKFLEVAEAA